MNNYETEKAKSRVRNIVFNSYLVIEDVVQEDKVKVTLLTYLNKEHFELATKFDTHDGAFITFASFDLCDFEEFAEKYQLNLQIEDFDNGNGHGQHTQLLEFDDYFTDKNILDFIKAGDKCSFEFE